MFTKKHYGKLYYLVQRCQLFAPIFHEQFETKARGLALASHSSRTSLRPTLPLPDRARARARARAQRSRTRTVRAPAQLLAVLLRSPCLSARARTLSRLLDSPLRNGLHGGAFVQALGPCEACGCCLQLFGIELL